MKTNTETGLQASAPQWRMVHARRSAPGAARRWGGWSSFVFLGRQEQGGALVEVALLLPVFLMVITGICTFAMAFNNELTLTSAVGAGAQQLQLIRTTTADPCADTLSAIEAAAPGLNGSNIGLTITMGGTSFSGSSCSGDQTYLSAGNPVTVSATYPCALAIYGNTFSNTCQLSAKVTEYEY